MSSFNSAGFLFLIGLPSVYLSTIYGWPAIIATIFIMGGTMAAIAETEMIVPRINLHFDKRKARRRLK